jgi:hypothetical protein
MGTLSEGRAGTCSRRAVSRTSVRIRFDLDVGRKRRGNTGKSRRSSARCHSCLEARSQRSLARIDRTAFCRWDKEFRDRTCSSIPGAKPKRLSTHHLAVWSIGLLGLQTKRPHGENRSEPIDREATG